MIGLICLSVTTLRAQESNCKPSKVGLRLSSYTFSYDDSGRLEEVVDNSDNHYVLIYGADGKVQRMNYLEDGELLEWMIFKGKDIQTADGDGSYETYRYESGENGFPVKVSIVYPNGEITYVEELTWDNGNIIEIKGYKPGEEPKISKFKYDDKPNPLRVLRSTIDYIGGFNYAEVLSANNIADVNIPGETKYSVPIEYTDSGCPTLMSINRDRKGYKKITY